MQAWLAQKSAEKNFVLRVNMVELRGSARSQAFSIGKEETFGALREKIATKAGRPGEVRKYIVIALTYSKRSEAQYLVYPS